MIEVKTALNRLEDILDREFVATRGDEHRNLLARRKRDIVRDLESYAVVEGTEIPEKQWNFFKVELLTEMAESIMNDYPRHRRMVAEAANYLHGCHRRTA